VNPALLPASNIGACKQSASCNARADGVVGCACSSSLLFALALIVSAKSRGGGLELNGGRLTLSHTVFRNNTVRELEGGAIVVRSESVGTVDSCTFEANSAATGGGAILIEDNVDDSEFKITRCTFLNNHAAGPGGSVIRQDDSMGDFFTDNTFTGSESGCCNVEGVGTAVETVGAGYTCVDMEFSSGRRCVIAVVFLLVYPVFMPMQHIKDLRVSQPEHV
jgi:predicted outer membrane repeat protein